MPLLRRSKYAAGTRPGHLGAVRVDAGRWPRVVRRRRRRADGVAASMPRSCERVPPQQLMQPHHCTTPISATGREADATTDPPENVWYEVKFDQEYEVDRRCRGRQLRSMPSRSTPKARPCCPACGVSDETPETPARVKFGPKEDQIHTAILDKQTAESLIERGICKLGAKKIYRRKLTDYERKFRSINDRDGRAQRPHCGSSSSTTRPCWPRRPKAEQQRAAGRGAEGQGQRRPGQGANTKWPS